MPATATTRTNVRQTTVTEGLTSSSRVDREAGVIKNVKLIGFESKNRRIYGPKVLKQAVHLYEGAKVNIDHPDGNDPARARKYGERFGVIRNVRFVEGQGNYGDFHFNPKHPLAEQVIWDAENNPESLGFSHNALLKLGPVNAQGKQAIESIVSIRSMDLVADPATTTSLFESQEPTMDEAPTDETATDPKAAMKGAFRQMIVAAVDYDSLDMKATMGKIKEIMKAQEKLMGGGSSAPGDDTDTDTETGEESVKNQDPEVALLKQQLEQYQAKEKQAALTESIDKAIAAAGLDPKNPKHVSELFSKQLLATESEDDRKALINDRAGLVGAVARTESTGNPVYQPGTSNVTESIDPKRWIA